MVHDQADRLLRHPEVLREKFLGDSSGGVLSALDPTLDDGDLRVVGFGEEHHLSLESGWGGRIRTCGNRSQNPVSYQLDDAPMKLLGWSRTNRPSPVTRGPALALPQAVADPGEGHAPFSHKVKSKKMQLGNWVAESGPQA